MRFDYWTMRILRLGCMAALLLCISGITGQSLAIGPGSQPHYFVPESGWLVEPVRAVDGRVGPDGCAMSVTYQNGYTFTVVRNQSGFTYMHVDLMQQALQTGAYYPVSFSVDKFFNSVLRVKAVSESAILFDLRRMPDFEKAVQHGDTMSLKLGSVKVDFSLQGFSNGAQRQQACLSGAAFAAMPAVVEGAHDVPQLQAVPVTATTEPDTGGKSVPLVVAMSKLIPQSYKHYFHPDIDPGVQVLVDETERDWHRALDKAVRKHGYVVKVVDQIVAIEPMAGHATQLLAQAAPPVAPAPAMLEDYQPLSSTRLWEAKKGMFVKDVIQDWSEDAGVNVIWDMDDNLRLPEDVAINATYNDAVKAVLGYFDNGYHRPYALIDANPKLNRFSPTTVYNKPVGSHDQPQRYTAEAQAMRWQALSGDSLKHTLSRWSQKSDVKYFWEAERDYYLPANFQHEGNYAEAVSKVLNMFLNAPVPLAAKLHEDPQSGTRALVVDKR